MAGTLTTGGIRTALAEGCRCSDRGKKPRLEFESPTYPREVLRSLRSSWYLHNNLRPGTVQKDRGQDSDFCKDVLPSLVSRTVENAQQAPHVNRYFNRGDPILAGKGPLIKAGGAQKRIPPSPGQAQRHFERAGGTMPFIARSSGQTGWKPCRYQPLSDRHTRRIPVSKGFSIITRDQVVAVLSHQEYPRPHFPEKKSQSGQVVSSGSLHIPVGRPSAWVIT